MVITSIYFDFFEAIIDFPIDLLDGDLDVVSLHIPGEFDDIPVCVPLGR